MKPHYTAHFIYMGPDMDDHNTLMSHVFLLSFIKAHRPFSDNLHSALLEYLCRHTFKKNKVECSLESFVDINYKERYAQFFTDIGYARLTAFIKDIPPINSMKDYLDIRDTIAVDIANILPRCIKQTTICGMLLYCTCLIPPFTSNYLYNDALFINHPHCISIIEELNDKRPYYCIDGYTMTRDGVSMPYNVPVDMTSVDSEVVVIGDVHSTIWAFPLILLKYMHAEGDGNQLKPNKHVFFTGDIVDRGPYNLEGLLIAWSLKYYNSKQVFIVNGNHETYVVEGFFGNKSDLMTDMLSKITPALRTNIQDLILHTPSMLIAYLKYDKDTIQNIYISHGGFPVKYDKELANDYYKSKTFNSKLKRVFTRSSDLKPEYMVPVTKQELFNASKMSNKYENQMLWNDYSSWYNTVTSNRAGNAFYKLTEEASYANQYPIYTLGTHTTEMFMNLWNIDLIITGHQDTEAIQLIPDHSSKDELAPKTRKTTEHPTNLLTYDPDIDEKRTSITIDPSKINGIITSAAFYTKGFKHTSYVSIKALK